MPKTSQKDTRKALQRHASGDLAAQLATIDYLSDSANRDDSDVSVSGTSAAISDRQDLLETLATMNRAATVNDAHLQILMIAKHLITLDAIQGELEHDNERANRSCYRRECVSVHEQYFARQERQFKKSLEAVSRMLFSLNAYFQANGSTVPGHLVGGYLPDNFDPQTLERKALAKMEGANLKRRH